MPSRGAGDKGHEGVHVQGVRRRRREGGGRSAHCCCRRDGVLWLLWLLSSSLNPPRQEFAHEGGVALDGAGLLTRCGRKVRVRLALIGSNGPLGSAHSKHPHACMHTRIPWRCLPHLPVRQRGPQRLKPPPYYHLRFRRRQQQLGKRHGQSGGAAPDRPPRSLDGRWWGEMVVLAARGALVLAALAQRGGAACPCAVAVAV